MMMMMMMMVERNEQAKSKGKSKQNAKRCVCAQLKDVQLHKSFRTFKTSNVPHFFTSLINYTHCGSSSSSSNNISSDACCVHFT